MQSWTSASRKKLSCLLGAVTLMTGVAQGRGLELCNEGKDARCLAKRIVEAKGEVTHDFLDPASVQWRSLYFSKGAYPDNVVAICGEVNGKNSYGAYAGYRPFYVLVVGGDAVGTDIARKDVYTEGRTVFDFEYAWKKVCKEKLADIKE